MGVAGEHSLVLEEVNPVVSFAYDVDLLSSKATELVRGDHTDARRTYQPRDID